MIDSDVAVERALARASMLALTLDGWLGEVGARGGVESVVSERCTWLVCVTMSLWEAVTLWSGHEDSAGNWHLGGLQGDWARQCCCVVATNVTVVGEAAWQW